MAATLSWSMVSEFASRSKARLYVMARPPPAMRALISPGSATKRTLARPKLQSGLSEEKEKEKEEEEEVMGEHAITQTQV